jgi:hypothetical protein
VTLTRNSPGLLLLLAYFSLPERANELGLTLWRTIDSADYALLADEMPELRPRGDPAGYRRKY